MMSPQSLYPDALLDAKSKRQDPAADSLIEEVVKKYGHQKAREVFDLLTRNVNLPLDRLPEAVVEFIRSYSELPEWADNNRINKAVDLFIDHGPKMLLLLYYKSLPTLYSYRTGAEVLVRTGKLTNKDQSLKIFARRVAETGQFLMDVMAPGGLMTKGKGIGTILKVRLVHASVRHFIAGKEWDVSKFGKPINQEQLAITLMTFSYSILQGLQQFNVEVKEVNREAFIHAWNVVGHLLGVDEDLLPEDYNQAGTLLKRILDRNARPSEAGKLLTHSLIDFSETTLPGEKLDHAPQVLIRFLVGEKMAEDLGVTDAIGCLGFAVPAFLRFLAPRLEKLEDRSEPLHLLADALSKVMIRQMVGYFDHYKGRQFAVPDALKQQWGV